MISRAPILRLYCHATSSRYLHYADKRTTTGVKSLLAYWPLYIIFSRNTASRRSPQAFSSAPIFMPGLSLFARRAASFHLAFYQLDLPPRYI